MGRGMAPSKISQKEHIRTARYYYIMLQAGENDAEQVVPLIREELSLAGLDAGALDQEGLKTSDQIERELTGYFRKARTARIRSAKKAGGHGPSR